MSISMDTKTRTYDMTARGEAASLTRDAIVSAVIECVTEQRSLGITLAAVAERAGVTVKTVLRHFGNRDAMIDAAWAQVHDEVVAERAATRGDLPAALTILIAHYERRGDMMIGLLAEEDVEARARDVCESGRATHRTWVESVFAERLPNGRRHRDRLVDTLVVATDMYSWKLLRRDRGLSADEVQDRMMLMCNGILREGSPP